MKSFTYQITDPMGLHVRPVGLLVKEARKYASKITLIKDEKSADATRMMALMGMGCREGDTVTVEVTGEDEETAAEALMVFFKENL